jgi:universal stress protein A
MMKAYANILCATDFSGHSDRALERAAELAGLYNGRLSLLHIVEYFPEDIPVDMVRPEDLDLEDYMVDRARKELTRLASGLEIKDVVREVRVSSRSARHEIVQYALENSIDLIVLASHGRHWVDALFGSTASGVVRHAPCDVLAVRAA